MEFAKLKQFMVETAILVPVVSMKSSYYGKLS